MCNTPFLFWEDALAGVTPHLPNFEWGGVAWSHSPWSSNCLGWIRVNLLWLNYPPWIDSSWITLVWFDPIELELPSLVYKSMFDILRLGGSCRWFFWMVVDYGCSYL